MKIALVGGIYCKSDEFRRKLQVTPETILERGFRERGHEVATYGHYKCVNSTRFDIVHVHHLSYGAARMALDSGSAAFAYTSHDPFAMVGQLNVFRRRAARFVMSRADAVVALSVLESDFQERSYPLSGAAHPVIPNGVYEGSYHYGRKNNRARNGPWHLLYVGQLAAQKNVDVLLRALAQLTQRVELSLIYHNSTLEDSLRTLVSELGLQGRAQFLGARSPQELAAEYQNADLFVLPSSAEALPSVITEAMLCGTPVVATDVGGVREQLAGYGVCVGPGDPAALASAISCVLDNYDRFVAQGEAASVYASERFSVDHMVDHHLELYTDLLARRGPRRRHSAMRVPIDAILRTGVSVICATK